MWISSKRNLLFVAIIAVTAWLALAFTCSEGYAQGNAKESSPYAVLIVGDESNAQVAKAEKSLISEMTKLLSSKDPQSGKFLYSKARNIEVFSYHINQEREKKYCEKSLNILAEDVLFVGIIEISGRMPKRVVYRVDRIINERRAALSVISHIEDMLNGSSGAALGTKPAQTTATAATSTAKPATKPATKPEATKPEATKPEATKPQDTKPEQNATTTVAPAAPSGQPEVVSTQAPTTTVTAPVAVANAAPSKYFRCQIGAFSSMENVNKVVSQLSAKGHVAKVEKIFRDGKTLFRVFVGAFSSREAASELLTKLKSDGFAKTIVASPAQ